MKAQMVTDHSNPICSFSIPAKVGPTNEPREAAEANSPDSIPYAAAFISKPLPLRQNGMFYTFVKG